MTLEPAIRQSIDYLASPAALASLTEDPYWPKWDSPWWHMLLLHELGEAKRIPPSALQAMTEALNRLPTKDFPHGRAAIPSGIDPIRGIACHCEVGSIYQVLSAAGLDVDTVCPWLRPRLLAHVMEDGGQNCDHDAYVSGEGNASSMVATVPNFEAVLLHTPRPFTAAEDAYLTRTAQFLFRRRLVEGSVSRHNAEERKEAIAWRRPFFPRFYFYDVLRGLVAVMAYAKRTGREVPVEAIREAYEELKKAFPSGVIVNAYQPEIREAKSLRRDAEGVWVKPRPAGTFPLLDVTSQPEAPAPVLFRDWARVRAWIRKDPRLARELEP